MSSTTPAARRLSAAAGHTPASSGGRHKPVAKTPQSTLTPNDDAAERASTRRKRQSQALRMSLADAFAGQQPAGGDQAQRAGTSSGGATLSSESLNTLFEQCIRLAAENKITDRNVWQLNLISHLPDIVVAGAGAGGSAAGSSAAGGRGFNFQKMSGGLDAGVTIYSKRVDLTYKEAFMSLASGPGARKGDDGGDEDDEADAGEPGLEDAAAAAARAQKAGKRGRGGGAADEEATLAAPEALRAKKGDTSFAVDPMFHAMSALFDEGGAKGLLLLNRSVYDGAHIMAAPHDVPEAAFPLAVQEPTADALLDLAPLQQQLAACSARQQQQGRRLLTPDLDQLYQLLQASSHRSSEQQPAGVDAGAVMRQATRGLRPTPLSGRLVDSSSGQAGAASCDQNTSMTDAPLTDPDAAADADDASGEHTGSSMARHGAAGGPGSAPVVAAFLASCEAAAGEDDAEAAAAGGFDDDGEGHEGYGDDDGGTCFDDSLDDWPSHQRQPQEEQQARRQSMMGLAGAGAEDAGDVLDADALQQLLGGGPGGQAGGAATRGGATTQGTGWAGSRFWKYRSAAAAAARMASGSGGASAPIKRAAAAGAAGGRSKSAAFRVDFTAPPADLAAALVKGSRRQTCLLTAAAGPASATLLPEDLHYQAANLAQLFLRPSAVSTLRQQQQQGWDGEGGAGGDFEAGDDGDGGDAAAGWEGYEDDDGGDGGGAWDEAGGAGYNAGDLSVGDPGFSSGASSAWLSAEGGELLSAPKRVAGLGVSYQRTAKQVDVRALKDLMWDSLVGVHGMDDGAAGGSSSLPEQALVPFQSVIERVPAVSAAGALPDVSVHMCFICMLHLANERGLVIKGREDLAGLSISNVVPGGGAEE